MHSQLTYFEGHLRQVCGLTMDVPFATMSLSKMMLMKASVK